MHDANCTLGVKNKDCTRELAKSQTQVRQTDFSFQCLSDIEKIGYYGALKKSKPREYFVDLYWSFQWCAIPLVAWTYDEFDFPNHSLRNSRS